MEEHGGGLEHLVTEKGPGKIPVWAYGVGIAGIVIVWQLFGKGSSSQSSQNPSQNAPAGTGPGNASTTITTVTRSGGGVWRSPWHGWGPGGGGISAPGSNEQWEALAADWLIGLGEHPGTVHDALTDYLDGEGQSGHRDAHERALVRMAINQWGNPPEPPGTPWGNPGDAPKSRGRLLSPGSPQGDIPIGSDAPPAVIGGGSGGGNSGGGTTKDVTNERVNVRIDERRRRR